MSDMTTNAERQRAYRARKGADIGGPPGPKPTAPCGTVSAYKRHRRKGEQPCADCAAAWAAWQRDYYAGRKA